MADLDFILKISQMSKILSDPSVFTSEKQLWAGKWES